MQRFTALYQALDETNATGAKVAAMRSYFESAPPEDAAWAVYFLTGRRLKRLVPTAELKQWVLAATGMPDWLLEETYASVGDLAETLALLLDSELAPPESEDMPLHRWVGERLLALRGMEPEQRQHAVTAWWAELPTGGRFVLNKMLTGAFRVGVSRRLVVRALAQASGLDAATVTHRLMGHWEPTAAAFGDLLDPEDRGEDASRPYPFFLASPLEGKPASLGPVAEWQAEWKWDGIRGQLLRRNGDCYLWSRGEDLMEGRFPEIEEAAERLPDGVVLDGEILIWIDDAPAPFHQLQRRIGRLKPSARMLREVPALFLAYDLLEWRGEDCRQHPLGQRRQRMEALLNGMEGAIRVSRPLAANSWTELAAHREQARELGTEGLMLKRLGSPYRVGRTRGDWWKWKLDPLTIDAVMLYAQPGHGRRSSLFTDYTFGVWSGETLVPVAKAYSGLDNVEIEALDRWIRGNTIERFGPVRSVRADQVFELAFEGIAESSRHKSGVALRFPRISRWRHDLGIKDADTLEQVRALLPEQPS
ncbi:MAG: ATP-dependent DNA ligase [Ectothiorhodospiraceae bacterium]|nr:ATP-dependent DNA ligase [Ectothiorhodospiraceae bacterium]MCH8505356.1 ATP-dependent DNA ligase [Ectothiorhodospiraceae bacterium]